MFDHIYNRRRVLITGHTGFKGSWLTAWLLKLGAEVFGVSKDIPTQPSMFEELGLKGRVKHIQQDIRDLSAVQKLIHNIQPDFIFHLAAQSIVSTSYIDPAQTISTNVIGTMNILEALRTMERPCIAVLITSDKCYDNVEWVWGYRESDQLGGKDVYSGSKGAAELVIKSYLHSFFQNGHPVRLAVGRAGNVIGGGDWAQDRIVVDCMRAWSEGRIVEIRSPQSTRPWQHVLEPLSGYLTLGQTLAQQAQLHGEAFNFGPRAELKRTVVELLEDLSKHWGFTHSSEAYQVTDHVPFHEAGLLKLNCDKALFHLQWEPTLDYSETIRLLGDWYKTFYRAKGDMYALTLDQIASYENRGAERKRIWAQPQ
ncbi:MAG: CDP-glucose 4,6-dehydratase [Candidatus Vogelbacteria bacterium]|nr:CDP-glucose 4,6-dehydratase [Candidatus Vogelbacteria bacterium]